MVFLNFLWIKRERKSINFNSSNSGAIVQTLFILVVSSDCVTVYGPDCATCDDDKCTDCDNDKFLGDEKSNPACGCE